MKQDLADNLLNQPLRLKRPENRRSMSRSASRALDVLEYFGRARRPSRAVEISRALEMHPSTANQLLKTLVESGHLVFDGQAKTYLPSPRLIGFSSWVVASYGAVDRYRMMLRDIHAATGALVTLTAPNDLFMQVVDVEGPSERDPRGLHVSLFASAAIGNAYLSAIPNAEIERLSRRARLPRQAYSQLLRIVSHVRKEGFSEGPTIDGRMHAIAVPLPAIAPTPLVVAIAAEAERVQNQSRTIYGKMCEAIVRWGEVH